jgi:DNA-binding NarL/FixJ family response regulator
MSDLFAIYEAHVTGATASGALQTAKQQTFDLVITDVTVPDFEGHWPSSGERKRAAPTDAGDRVDDNALPLGIKRVFTTVHDIAGKRPLTVFRKHAVNEGASPVFSVCECFVL